MIVLSSESKKNKHSNNKNHDAKNARKPIDKEFSLRKLKMCIRFAKPQIIIFEE